MAMSTAVRDMTGPLAAVAHPPRRLTTAYLPHWFHVYGCWTVPLRAREPGKRAIAEFAGSGRSDDPDLAYLISIVEALERLAVCVIPREPMVADARSLPNAIDLNRLPRCSDRELADPRCPLGLANPDTPIRWTPSVDLSDGSVVLVPTVMVYLSRLETERFWLPITTGVAAATTWESALISAICEVLERDMVSTIWLQRLSLPKLDFDVLPPAARRLVEWCERKFIQTHLFDATSEVGVPIVYCVQESPHDMIAGRIVGASAHLDLGQAADHALREAISLRPMLHAAAENPDESDQMTDGALEIGAPRSSTAMDFLLRAADADRRALVPMRELQSREPVDRLDDLVGRCERAGHRIYAVDLSTPELREIGLYVARAVMPSLQPLTFSRHARYLGHPRLYRLPALLGYPVRVESELNHDPQPFA
jgi:ribosomal protein S12 methylthiotransferase accessory factor